MGVLIGHRVVRTLTHWGRLNRRPFADDIFKFIFLNGNELILPRISLKFVPKVRINNIPALVQIMAWRSPCDKPLSEPMIVSLLKDICVTRPQWVKEIQFKCIWTPKGKCIMWMVCVRFCCRNCYHQGWWGRMGQIMQGIGNIQLINYLKP